MCSSTQPVRMHLYLGVSVFHTFAALEYLKKHKIISTVCISIYIWIVLKMAACADTAALSSRTYKSFFILFSLLSLLFQALCQRIHYKWDAVLKFKNYTLWDLNPIPPEILRPEELSRMIIIPPVRRQRRRRDRKQKQGKRAGAKARLQANPHKPMLPSLFLELLQMIH